MMLKNYMYSIDFKINGSHNCESYGCDDEGICRCYTIDSVIIKNINISNITRSIFNQFFNINSTSYIRDNKLSLLINGHTSIEENMYCIDRILRINKLYKIDNWKAQWGGGYYGDELDNIHIIENIYKKIIDLI